MGTKVAILKSHITGKGGLEKHTLGLFEAFQKRGCEVVLLTTTASASPHSKQVAKRSKFSLYHVLHFDACCQRWLRHNPCDIVFGMERNRFQTHYRAGSGVHATYLQRRALNEPWHKQLSFRLNPFHRTILTLEKTAFEYPKLHTLFTNSHMVKQEILSTYTTPEEKIEVVHNGVEWTEWEKDFIASLDRATCCQKLGLDPDKFQFLFVGNGYQRKGLSFLLKALQQLKPSDYQLSIVGKDRQKHASTPHIKFFGPQSDVRPFYQAADSLVLPSIYDPFANVTVEALAMGLYVISSRYNGGSEVLTPQNGTIIEELTDTDSLVSCLRQAMSLSCSPLSIRESIKHLDFSHQLDKIVSKTLCTY